MLGLAKRVGAKILQASTSEVYGDPTMHPQVEEYRGNASSTPMARACIPTMAAWCRTLRDGLARTVEYFDKRVGAQKIAV